jgi:predicted GNAT family acetyltransferase
MYIDIAKYGLDHPEMKVWISGDGGAVSSVVMKYFTSMQVYSPRSPDMLEIAPLVQQERVPIITGTAEAMRGLLPLLSGGYEASYGWTFEVDSFRPFSSPEPIVLAEEDDMAECAALICSDASIGGYYACENLTRQLMERRSEGMGRNYIIRKDGCIIAHIATYAEFENLAVSSGLIVHPEYRDLPYGTFLESHLINELLAEGKRVFSFLHSEKRVKYYRALGITRCWNNGKLTRGK